MGKLKEFPLFHILGTITFLGIGLFVNIVQVFVSTCNTTVTVYPIYVVYLQFSTSESLEQSGDRLFLTSTDAFPQVGKIEEKTVFVPDSIFLTRSLIE